LALGEAQQGILLDRRAFRALDPQATWSVEWRLIVDSAKPVARFRPGDVLVEAWAGSKEAVFWDPMRRRKRRHDGARVNEPDVAGEPLALHDEPDDDDADSAADWASDASDAWDFASSAEQAKNMYM